MPLNLADLYNKYKSRVVSLSADTKHFKLSILILDTSFGMNLNVTYRWINSLGGGELPGPIEWGTLRPDGKPAHGGNMTIT